MSQPSTARRWLDVARVAFFEELYRRGSVLLIGAAEPAIVEVLVARGATKVVVVDPASRERGVSGRVETRGDLPPPSQRFDVILIQEATAWLRGGGDRREGALSRLAHDGWLIAAAANGDRGEEGLGYFELHDRLAHHFPTVTMVGQARFGGTSLAPFGDEEIPPRFDPTFGGPVDAQIYVAVCGPRRPSLGYGLASLPVEAWAEPAPPLSPGPEEVERREGERQRLDAERRGLLEAVDELKQAREKQEQEQARAAKALLDRDQAIRRLDGELKAAQRQREEQGRELQLREKRLLELRASATRSADEVQAIKGQLEERDAYLAKLEGEARVGQGLRRELAETCSRLDETEGRERAARRRVAELEGALVRLEQSACAPVEDPRLPALVQRLTELEQQNEKLRQRAEDAQREAWGHLRARSEAEAAAAEVREDTVRKLKDARKVANLELMRAMEEATKKAVTLKEELVRSEAERKEALGALRTARGELEALSARVRLMEEQEEAMRRGLVEARARNQALDERLSLDAANPAPSLATGDAGSGLTQRLAEVEAELAGVTTALGEAKRDGDEARRALEEHRERAVRALNLAWDLRQEAREAAAQALAEHQAAAAAIAALQRPLDEAAGQGGETTAATVAGELVGRHGETGARLARLDQATAEAERAAAAVDATERRE